MNVLFLQDHGGLGGAQLSLLDLLKGFTTFDSNIVPHVVVGEGGFLFDELVRRGVSAEIAPMPRFDWLTHFFRRAPFVRRLLQICRQRNIEIIHANNHDVAPWSAMAARKTRVLSCCTVRWLIDSDRAEKNRVFENERVIAISKTIQEGLGVSDPVKIRQIYRGVELPNFIPSDESVLSVLKIPAQGGKKVGFMGALTGRKGPQVLIEAIPTVLAELPDTVFIFIGGGNPKFVERLQSRAAQLGVAENIVFTGRLPFGARYLKLLDLFVLTSLKEPLGRVTAEAMYAGLPVVGSDSGGTPEIIQHDRTGRLVPPGRPEPLAREILFYLKNDETRKKHGEVARQRATKLFDITACAKRIEELYIEMRESVKHQ